MEFDPQRLAQARHLVVFSGAGVSAESAIPTFRDALTGLWENFDP
ncbi:Sir2 family NAD-dependent protein deacetylase, partial [Pseudomonas protegens]